MIDEKRLDDIEDNIEFWRNQKNAPAAWKEVIPELVSEIRSLRNSDTLKERIFEAARLWEKETGEVILDTNQFARFVANYVLQKGKQ